MKLIFIFLIFSITHHLHSQNPSFVTINTEYNIAYSIDSGNYYLRGWGELTPIISTYIDNAGLVSICSFDINSKETYIYEYSKDLQHIKTLKFTGAYSKFGSFTKDEEGNYYFFYGSNTSNRNFENMAMLKSDSDGNIIKKYTLIAYAPNSFSGIRLPFSNGACRLELSGSVLAVYFAREMFNGHQASYGFMLDRDTFERVDRGQAQNNGIMISGNNVMPYVSHSFNQFILPIEGGFVFADQGDSFPRAFSFAKFQMGKETKILNSFMFKKSGIYQYTFAQLGGLAKTSSGYIFVGTYEKNSIVSHSSHNDSRNLFILTFNDELTSCSRPVWITNYADKNTENAASPKIAVLENGRYLLMWELMNQYSYVKTFMKIIDENGEPLSGDIELPNIRLNINDVLRYNKATGNIHWAVNNGRQEIIVYSLNPDDLQQ